MGRQIAGPPKADLALKPASEIAKGIDAGMLTKLASDSTRADVLIDGADQMLHAAKVEAPHGPWPLPSIAPSHHAVTVMLQIAGLITVLSVLVAVALLTVAVSRQLRRLGLVSDALRDIASGEGDLTRRLETQGGTAGRHCHVVQPVCGQDRQRCWSASANLRSRCALPRPRLPAATRICRHALNSKQARWKKPPPPWKN